MLIDWLVVSMSGQTDDCRVSGASHFDNCFELLQTVDLEHSVIDSESD